MRSVKVRKGELAALALVLRRPELSARRFQVRLGIRHELVKGAMPPGGSDQAAVGWRRDDTG